jgi:hypothetical protein
MFVMEDPFVIVNVVGSFASGSVATTGAPTLLFAPVFSPTPIEMLGNTGGSFTFVTVTVTELLAHSTGDPLSHTVRFSTNGAEMASKLNTAADTMRAQAAVPDPSTNDGLPVTVYLLTSGTGATTAHIQT